MSNRSRNYYRKVRARAIHRKKGIIERYHQNPGDYWRYEGMASKGKIHCSCPMCAFHGTSAQDKRKLISMSQAAEYYGFTFEDDSIIDNITISGIGPLINSMKKEINGRWYPKRA